MYVCKRWGTKHYFQTDTQQHTATEKKIYDVFIQQLLLQFPLIFLFIYDPFQLFFQQILPCLSMYNFPVFLSPNSKVGQKISLDGLLFRKKMNLHWLVGDRGSTVV